MNNYETMYTYVQESAKQTNVASDTELFRESGQVN